MEEKRKNKRYLIDKNKILISIDNDIIDKPLNMSLSGISIQIDNAYLIDKLNSIESVFLKIKSNDNEISIKCKIVWNIYDSFGLKFMNLSDKNKEIIKEIIRYLELK